MFIRLIFVTLFVFSYTLKATEVTVIDLHKQKSLDQLVLENDINTLNEDSKENTKSLNPENDITEVIVNSEESNFKNKQNESTETTSVENNTESENTNLEEVTLIISESLFDIDERIIQYNLESINEIKSNTLSKEFIKILSSSKSEDQKNFNKKIYFIIKKLYEIGEIKKSYNLIKNINLDLLSNKEHLVYFQVIQLNYLLSTFKSTEVCELRTLLLEKSITLPNFLLEKTDIFCLILDNKFAEAKLLNSLLKDSEKLVDINFQKLFDYMILENKDDVNFEPINLIKSKDLIFLYSAMLRINDLPLTEDFINIDPLNLSIPVILSDSTPMSIRIKAANQSYYDELISVDSLSALYQSVDFNSKQFNSPEQTIRNLNTNNELIMAFYFQLANMQIFPEDRLGVLIDFWKFSKDIGLEKIAYSVTKNIIESFTPSSQNSKYGMQIALAHISNQNYDEALKWLKVFDNSEVNKSELEYAKFLINLYETDDLNTIINFLMNISNNLDTNTSINILETVDVLSKFLKIETNINSNFDYEIISEDRVMPPYFLVRDIEKNLVSQKDITLFLLSITSMNNQDWHELHPEHLSLMLEAFNLYDQGSLIKSIILEIINDLKIIQ